MSADPEFSNNDDYSKEFVPYKRMTILAWFASGGYAVLTVIWTGKYMIPVLRGPGFLSDLSLFLALGSSILVLIALFFFANWNCPQCGKPFGNPGYRGPLRCQNCQLEVPRRDA